MGLARCRQGARRSRCGAIGDDEQRGIHLATPMRPKGSGRRGPSAALLLLDDGRTSSSEKRLASDSTTPRTQPRVFLGQTPTGGLFNHPVVFSLCVYKRLSRTPPGEVVLRLKTPYRNGTTHVVMALLEFLQRLAALVRDSGSTSFTSMAYSPQRCPPGPDCPRAVPTDG